MRTITTLGLALAILAVITLSRVMLGPPAGLARELAQARHAQACMRAPGDTCAPVRPGDRRLD